MMACRDDNAVFRTPIVLEVPIAVPGSVALPHVFLRCVSRSNNSKEKKGTLLT